VSAILIVCVTRRWSRLAFCHNDDLAIVAAGNRLRPLEILAVESKFMPISPSHKAGDFSTSICHRIARHFDAGGIESGMGVEPRRLRDRDHVRRVAQQPCLVCCRQPSDPHNLRFTQSRELIIII
jgi:hypothetical protein